MAKCDASDIKIWVQVLYKLKKIKKNFFFPSPLNRISEIGIYKLFMIIFFLPYSWHKYKAQARIKYN